MSSIASEPSGNTLGPPWLAHAWAELGQSEIAGPAANARIVAFYRDAGHPEITRDEVAWCAAFAGAVLARAGHRPTGSLLARSYLTWGEPLDAPRLGAIAVFSRGSDPGAGHVGFLLAAVGDDLAILGGNQSDAVSVALIPNSRLLGFRWPSPEPDTAAPPLSPVRPDTRTTQSSDGFPAALALVLDSEAGFTDDPADPGGPTYRGITLAEFARRRGVALTAASRDTLLGQLRAIGDVELRTIYHQDYWLAASCPALPPWLAAFHFDTAVNMGTRTAILMLQTALGVEIDGEVGPQTLAAASAADPATLLGAYADLRRRRYRSLPTFPRFGRGWLARVDRTLTFSRSLAKQKGSRPMTETTTPTPAIEPKWWGNSTTIWGAVIAGLAAVLPAVGPAVGLEIPKEAITESAEQIGAIVQAATGLAGTLIAIFGRVRAVRPLTRKDITIKL